MAEEPDTIIARLATHFALPAITVTTARIICAYVQPRLNVPKAEIVRAALFLAAKATESSLSPDAYAHAAGEKINAELEVTILKLLKFNVDYFDMAEYAAGICTTLGIDKTPVVNKIEALLASERISSIGFMNEKGLARPQLAALAAFSEKERELFALVYSVKVDLECLKEISSELYD